MSINYTSAQPQRPSSVRSNQDRRGRRDEIVREYNQQSASRARWARLSAQDALKTHMQNSAKAKARELERAELENKRKERSEIEARRRAQARDRAASEARTDASANEHSDRSRRQTPRRVVAPLSSKEYQEKTRRSFEHYERERALRDPYSRSAKSNTNREVIDGRGTIDSRAFNELEIITNKTIDKQDRHEASVTVNDSSRRWRTTEASFSSSFSNSRDSEGNIAGMLGFYKQLPPFVQISIPVIALLVIILIFLLVKG